MRARTLHSHPGQALVEMTLAMGVLLLVILGAIAALQVLAVQYTINQAVRTAAHEAALLGSTDGLPRGVPVLLTEAPGQVAAAARQSLSGGIATRPERATITASCEANPCRRYSAITIRIQYNDDVWVPIPMLTKVTADRTATRASERDQQ